MSDTKVNSEMIEDSGKVSSGQIQPNSVSSAEVQSLTSFSPVKTFTISFFVILFYPFLLMFISKNTNKS